MTVMPTDTRELDIETIIYRAAQRAGIISFDTPRTGAQWLNKVSFGCDMLESIVDALQLEGVILRDVTLTDVTLTAGVGTYTLASDTIDVSGVGMYANAAGEPTSQVAQMDREAYQAWPDKSTTARPTQMWVEKKGAVILYLLPVPDTTSAILTVQRKHLLADNSASAATPDLERYWTKYLMDELAYEFSVGMPISERALLRSNAKASKEIAQTGGRSTVANQMVLSHPTGWSR